MDDERKDKLDYIQVEVTKAVTAHAGELHELLRLMLGASFHGVSFEEIKDDKRNGFFATICVDPGLDKRDIEATIAAVQAFTPKPEVETPAPTVEEALKQLDDIQRQLDKLRADLEKM